MTHSSSSSIGSDVTSRPRCFRTRSPRRARLIFVFLRLLRGTRRCRSLFVVVHALESHLRLLLITDRGEFEIRERRRSTSCSSSATSADSCSRPSVHSRVERVGLVPGFGPSGGGSENVHLDEALEVVARSVSRDVGLLRNPVGRVGLGTCNGGCAHVVEGARSFQSSATDSSVIRSGWR